MINPYKTRLELINLIQVIPDKELLSVKRIIEFLVEHNIDPAAIALLTASPDEEPLTPEEERAIKESREDIEAGRFKDWSEVRQELGL